jgi:hypothetical protein
MSGSTTTPNGSATSAVEYVRALSDEEKGYVFIALLRELIEVNGGGKCLIPIDTPEGESLGYYVPPKAAAARFEMYGPKFTPEEWAELERQKGETAGVITAEEWIAELRARAAELEKQTP